MYVCIYIYIYIYVHNTYYMLLHITIVYYKQASCSTRSRVQRSARDLRKVLRRSASVIL